MNSNGRSFMPEFKNILQNASRYYDYVLVDLRKGYKFEEQLEILEMSNVVILNIDQGIKSILNFFNTTELQIIGDKVIWNICRYDSKSKYNTKNLVRNILKKQYIFETHYNNDTRFGYFFFGNIGYRYQRPKGFVFRTGFTPSFSYGKCGLAGTFFYPYISFGWSF
jgi:hypothetical protein